LIFLINSLDLVSCNGLPDFYIYIYINF